MNAARRGFLKILGAAPVAGPALVKSTLDGIVGSVPVLSAGMLPRGAPPYTSSPACENETDWLRQNLSQLLRARKEVEGGSTTSTNSFAIAASEADSLKSISPRARISMAVRRAREIEKASELSYYDREIARVKEKLGPLAALIFEE